MPSRRECAKSELHPQRPHSPSATVDKWMVSQEEKGRCCSDVSEAEVLGSSILWYILLGLKAAIWEVYHFTICYYILVAKASKFN